MFLVIVNFRTFKQDAASFHRLLSKNKVHEMAAEKQNICEKK